MGSMVAATVTAVIMVHVVGPTTGWTVTVDVPGPGCIGSVGSTVTVIFVVIVITVFVTAVLASTPGTGCRTALTSSTEQTLFPVVVGLCADLIPMVILTGLTVFMVVGLDALTVWARQVHGWIFRRWISRRPGQSRRAGGQQ